MTTAPIAGLDLLQNPRVVDAAAADASCAVSDNPATGEPIAAVRLESRQEYDRAVTRAEAVQAHWRRLPAPKRGGADISKRLPGCMVFRR